MNNVTEVAKTFTTNKMLTLTNTLLVGLLAVTFAGHAIAAKQKVEAPEGFETVKTCQLDKAWVNPEFEPNDYDKIVITWDGFEYRPGKDRFYPRAFGFEYNDNFEMTQKAKRHLETDAVNVFAKKLGAMDNFEVVTETQADDQTMVVNFAIKDIVNHVPDFTQVTGRTKFYMRDFRAMTLDVEFQDATTSDLLFKGYVRDTVEAMGHDLEEANTFTANHRTKWKLNRWANGMERGLENIK